MGLSDVCAINMSMTQMCWSIPLKTAFILWKNRNCL